MADDKTNNRDQNQEDVDQEGKLGGQSSYQEENSDDTRKEETDDQQDM